MPESKEPLMHVVFRRAADYRTIAANGAWGGIAPSGEVVFDLHVDRRATPTEMDVFAEDDGTLREERDPKAQPIIREAQIGVVLAPSVAKSVGEFLIRYANQALGIAKDRSKE